MIRTCFRANLSSLYPRLDRKALQESFELFVCQLFRLFFASWPFELSCFKTLIQKIAYISFPYKRFYSVIPPSAEQEDSPL